MIPSGLFIGIGIYFGRGGICEHGICGLPLESKRSFVAVILFLLVGMVVANVRNHYYPFYFNEMN